MDRADWAPSPADVGSVIRSRTVNKVGKQLGTFTIDTQPTADQVSDLVDSVVSDIAADVGLVPDLVQDSARRVAAIGTACLVELSFFQEQINTNRSPYAQLKAWYDQAFARLKVQVANANDDGVIEDDVDLMPVYNFDGCDPSMIGLHTNW